MIGRLPYYYFLLLTATGQDEETDWKSAVFILPFTTGITTEDINRIGILPYLYSLLLTDMKRKTTIDWKTAVFILPSTFTDNAT